MRTWFSYPDIAFTLRAFKGQELRRLTISPLTHQVCKFRQCSMKGVSQGKTSPLPAVSILLCDGQPSTCPEKRPHGPVADCHTPQAYHRTARSLSLLKHAWVERRCQPVFYLRLRPLQPSPTAFFGHPRRHSVATGTRRVCASLRLTLPEDTQPRTSVETDLLLTALDD